MFFIFGQKKYKGVPRILGQNPMVSKIKVLTTSYPEMLVSPGSQKQEHKKHRWQDWFLSTCQWRVELIKRISVFNGFFPKNGKKFLNEFFHKGEKKMFKVDFN